MNRYGIIDGTNSCEEIAYFWFSPHLIELCAVGAGCVSVVWKKLVADVADFSFLY